MSSAPGEVLRSWNSSEGESVARRLLRRLVAVPGVFAGLILLLGLLPILLPAALLADAVRRDRFTLARLLLYGIVYLGCQALGLLASAGIWSATAGGRLGSRETWEACHYRLQAIWAAALLGGARVLFRLEVTTEGDASCMPGPVLLFVRHVSILDTLLPAVFLSGRHGLRLRYVLKRELLADPCLDLVGHRLPNVFIARGSGQSEREIERVRMLATDLGSRDGVLIYPEGTRATPERRQRALARLEAAGDASRLARARRLEHLLPPRSGGAFALLDGAPDADVLLATHVGLEGLARVSDVLSGGLVGRQIRLRIHRIPRAAIPAARPERLRWLDETWAEMDAWVRAHAG